MSEKQRDTPAAKRPYEKPEVGSITAQEILERLGPARANYGV